VNFSKVSKEVQRITLYKDTIKKQERVIVKMENMLSKTLKDTARVREGMLELEKLKTENLELQARLQNEGVPIGDDMQ